MKAINSFESGVRSYCRAFPTTFVKASGPFLYDDAGNKYLDFLCGAGSINYGHNHPLLKEKIFNYLNEDGVVHGLDLATEAKEEFLKTFQSKILAPRDLNYKIQFTGPTGTNAVEAALKLARKITKRNNVISFSNGFHGVTLGALAATANSLHRGGTRTSLPDVSFMPYDGYLGKKTNTLDYIRRFLEDSSSGVDLPAAFIVETIQGEGGINVASNDWLKSLEQLCKEFEIFLIVDDIQVGCGRTGTFFSFEEVGIEPDIVVLSKSLSGFGLPFSLLLIKPEFDKWKPGEHNGTFRGNNLAFVTATETINQFWSTKEFENSINEKSNILRSNLEEIVGKHLSSELDVRGKGMIFGVDCRVSELASKIQKQAFSNGLIIETCGSEDQVIKFLPPLIIDEDTLLEGLNIFENSVKQVVDETNIIKILEKEAVQK